MAGKQGKQKVSSSNKITERVKPPRNEPGFLHFFSRPLHQLSIIIIVACGLYAITLFNGFVLDDGMVISNNNAVLKGVSGIPDILTHDSFSGSIGDTKNLAGGRYRPVSLISYAAEISLFGKNPFVHHLINVLLYALTGLVLLSFLRKFIFPQQPICAFITTLLFVIHPIHTEVVANIKSRDEILSLLFLLLTIFYLLKFLKVGLNNKSLLPAILFFALALFSKENGLIFIALIPITIYFFSSLKVAGIIKISFPFLAVATLYLTVRIFLLGLRNNEIAEVMDNPYVMATLPQKLATIALVFRKYLQLLFLPHPLTYDYSYNQIPYRTFSDPLVLISMLINFSMSAYAFIRFLKKDLLSWCILFYLGTLFLVSNIFFNIGAPMAERFLYQASVPFLIAVVESASRILDFKKTSYTVATPLISILVIIVFIASSYVTVARNREWKSDETLFLHDVKISSGSARANTYAGVALIRMSDNSEDPNVKRMYALEAIQYFKKSEAIKPDYVPTLLNKGVAYSRLDSPETAESTWGMVRKLEQAHPNLKQYDDYLFQAFYRRGLKDGAEKNFFAAVVNLEKAVKYQSTNADAWYNLGGAYFSVRNWDKAKEAWEKTLLLDPENQSALQGLNAIAHRPAE
ncbi:MAG: tetratricopeptide repeat protein [Chitinophagales bacterium]